MITPPMNLADMLFSHGVRPKYWGPGHTEQIRCPKCEGGSTKETSLTITIDQDNGGAVWHCHRGNCGFSGGERLLSAEHKSRFPHERSIKTPQPHSIAVTGHKPDWFNGFFEDRGIGDRAVTALGIYGMESRRFPEPLGDSRCIVFPYTHNGTLVNRKYRPFPAKNPMMQDASALPTLFNIDRLGGDPVEIIFVEGEMDVCALFECGLEHAVTLKDGAGREVKYDPEAKRFEALRTHADVLTKAKRIVLAGDMDVPGLALREELARRLGRHRCWLVTWPKECKDAGDVLRIHGPDAVLNAVEAATAYPIDGLHKVTAAGLKALRGQSPPTTMSTGTMVTDRVLKLPTEGRLIVVTGYPSMGKTSWLRYVMVHTAEKHDRRWAVFGPEMQPWEQFAAECAAVWVGKPFWPIAESKSMSPEEIEAAGDWLENHVVMMACDSEDVAPTLDWILDLARAAVLRDGITDLLIDPWNEIEHMRPAMVTETDYIGRSLQRLKAFGLRYGCNIWVAVHPTKPSGLKTGEAKPPPGPYDISGSANWANKADLGLTVHSPERGKTDLIIWKTRFRRFGNRSDVATMAFDVINGRYTSPDEALIIPEAPAWRTPYKEED